MAFWCAASPPNRRPFLGVAGMILVGIPTVALLDTLGVASFSFGRFVLYKATFAGLAALVLFAGYTEEIKHYMPQFADITFPLQEPFVVIGLFLGVIGTSN